MKRQLGKEHSLEMRRLLEEVRNLLSLVPEPVPAAIFEMLVLSLISAN